MDLRTKIKSSFSNELAAIEKRLLEIEPEKARRIYDLHENWNGTDDDTIEEYNIEYLDIEKGTLQMRRQFILDRRESWLPKSIWNLIVPIVIAVIAAYITVKWVDIQ